MNDWRGMRTEGATNPMSAASRKPKTWVVRRVALEEHEGFAALAEHRQGRRDEIRADALALHVGANTDRAQDEHVLQPSRRVEDRVRVENMADEFTVVLGDEARDRLPTPTMPGARRGVDR